MKKKSTIVLFVIGVFFIVNTVIGRYLVVPGYLESLENPDVMGEVSGWKVFRYLFWAYSFKFAIYFFALAALTRTSIDKKRFSIYAIGGFIYIGWAYMPIPGPSWLFGIGGASMALIIPAILLLISDEREEGYTNTELSTDYKMIGYFFFAMATYNLCALLGTRTFALQPEKMIEYELQSDAKSFAAHILIELVIGWIFTLLSQIELRKSNK